ncbi:MAG: hypothetical protein V2G41_10130 [bacterium JZ-2024 1]
MEKQQKIVITCSTHPEYFRWNEDPGFTQEKAQVIATNCAKLAEAYARRAWPNADIETRVTDNMLARLVFAAGFGDNTDNNEVAWELESLISEYIYDEALCDAEFDANKQADKLMRTRKNSPILVQLWTI